MYLVAARSSRRKNREAADVFFYIEALSSICMVKAARVIRAGAMLAFLGSAGTLLVGLLLILVFASGPVPPSSPFLALEPVCSPGRLCCS